MILSRLKSILWITKSENEKIKINRGVKVDFIEIKVDFIEIKVDFIEKKVGKMKKKNSNMALLRFRIMYFHSCSIVWWVIDCNCC